MQKWSGMNVISNL